MLLRKSKLGQGGIEFLMVSAVVFFIFVSFYAAIQSSTETRYREKEEITIKNIALSVQDEINLATGATNGYQRDFYIPRTVSNKDYEIILVEGMVYVRTGRNAIALTINNVTGQIQKGGNAIKNNDGFVYLNFP